MGKNQSASNLTNIIKQDANGNISFVSGSTTLMSVSSSGAIATTGNVAGTASYATNAELFDGLDSTVFTLTSSFTAQTASFTAFTASQNILNGTYATTGSNTFTGIQTVNSNLIVTGSITAQTLVVQTITSSVDFVTGSTRFGSLSSNTHVITGSMFVTGAFYVTTGSVGIGTISPSGKLHVVGSGNYDGVLFVSSTGTNTPSVELGVDAISAADGYVGTSNNWPFYIRTNDANRIAVTTAGDIGIGTNSPAYKLDVYAASGYTARFNGATYGGLILASGSTANTYFVGESALLSIEHTTAINLRTNNADRVRITSAGYVGIDATTPYAKLHIGTASNNENNIFFTRNTSTANVIMGGLRSSLGPYWGDATSTSLSEINLETDSPYYRGAISFRTNNSDATANRAVERMRIRSNGFVGINVAPIYQFHVKANTDNDWICSFESGTTSLPIYGILSNIAAAPNNASSYFLYFADTASQRMSVRSNGGIYNFSANDSNLSDIRTKKDIFPLESYWNKFKAIEIVKFKYKDQTHDDYNIGVIAQQVEEIAPEFVDTDYWDDPKSEDRTEMKSIFTTDLYHTTIKVLQEAMAKIETLEAENDTLKEILQRNNIQ
jgi:hypothetical protein